MSYIDAGVEYVIPLLLGWLSSFLNAAHSSDASAAHYDLGRQLPYASGSLSLTNLCYHSGYLVLGHS